MKKYKTLTILALLLLGAATDTRAQEVSMTGGWNSVSSEYEYTGTFSMPAYDVEITTELWYKLDATKTFAQNVEDYGTKTDFFLDRTLTKDVWNTFASPFAIASGDMEEYFGAGAKVRKLDNTTIEEGNILSLNFVNATEIVAGHPYLVKPTAANVVDPTFEGVDLSAASATADETTYVNFVPTLGKTEVTGDVADILILNTAGTLVHPSAVGNMKGFRCYFVMHDAAALAKAFRIDYGDGETTGIIPISTENGSIKTEGTFDLQGRRVNSQITQKGIYIQNRRKVVIK